VLAILKIGLGQKLIDKSRVLAETESSSSHCVAKAFDSFNSA